MSLFKIGSVPFTPNPPKFFNDTVTPTNSTDIFQFSLLSSKSINIALSGITDGEAVALTLFKDKNNNGILDSTDTKIQATFDDGKNNQDDATINIRSLTAGTYFAQVTYSKFSSVNLVNYQIGFSSTSPGSATNLLPKEVELGNLDYASYQDQWLDDSDTSDTYHFTLDTNDVEFRLSITGLTGDADVRLIRDSNNNGFFDPGEVVARSMNLGTASEYITRNQPDTWLDAGSYFIQVYQYSGNISYDLSAIVLS